MRRRGMTARAHDLADSNASRQGKERATPVALSQRRLDIFIYFPQSQFARFDYCFVAVEVGQGQVSVMFTLKLLSGPICFEKFGFGQLRESAT